MREDLAEPLEDCVDLQHNSRSCEVYTSGSDPVDDTQSTIGLPCCRLVHTTSLCCVSERM